MARVTLPKYVQGFKHHRTGKPVYYFRRRGFKRVALPGEPWSQEFMAAYAFALEGRDIPDAAKRVTPGSFNAALLAYLASPAFKSIKSKETAVLHRGLLEGLARKHGDKPFKMLDRRGLEIVLAGMSAHGCARNLVGALRRMVKWSIRENMITVDPTDGVKVVMPKSDGWHTMTEAERDQYRRHHPIGTWARAAFEVLYFTALRRGDARRLGPAHIVNGKIRIAQAKTGGMVILPVHQEMIEAVDAAVKASKVVSINPSTFILGDTGLPYTSSQGFGNAVRRWCREAGLPHCNAHSIRKGTLTMLAMNARTVHQIAAYGGHKSLRMVEVYTRKAEQEQLADAAGDAFYPVSTGKPPRARKGKSA